MGDRYFEGRVQRQVKDLRVGDRVDLQNDRYADPSGFHGRYAKGLLESEKCAEMGWAYEFCEVTGIERETDICTRIDFDNTSCGFPPDHWIDVDGEQIREG